MKAIKTITATGFPRLSYKKFVIRGLSPFAAPNAFRQKRPKLI